jgi:Kef-type K+ transport system membrane component KefB
MKNGVKNIIFYVLMIAVFGGLMYIIAKEGGNHQKAAAVVTTTTATPENLTDGLHSFVKLFVEHIQSPFGILLLQIIVILFFCRIFSGIFLLIRQPTVIGEIIAGIVLGPSILGLFFPEISAFIFPPSSLANISLLSQFGLILFMFVIGMELNIDEVRKKLKETILISHASTIFPFFLGMLTAYFIYDKYASPETPFLSFALFIGIAMSVTAFPVLARIIQEKGLAKSHLGTISLASAANGDITAWCLLAIVVAIAQTNSMLSAIYNILFSAIYLVIMFVVVRPFLRMVGQVYHNEEVIDKHLVAFIFFVLTVSSFLTEILGLHALFGAFMAGVIMPADIKFRKIMSEKVEGVSLSLFLPLFFVSTGLKTSIGLLNTPELWFLCGILILVAIVGKFGGATLSARFVGESWKNSLYIGAFMNTRGLMELIILSIGYELKILTPPIFVMLVLMTLVTTFMTTPLLAFIQFSYKIKDKFATEKKPAPAENVFKLLLSFGRAGSGQILLAVAQQMFSRNKNKLEVTALHFTTNTDVNPLHRESFEAVSFAPILEEAKNIGMQIQTRYELSNNVGEDITTISNEGNYDFLLVGAGITWSNLPNDIAANQYRDFRKSKYFKPDVWFLPNELLKDKTKMFIEETHCPVGVFINRDFELADKTLLILNSEQDLYLLQYASDLLMATGGSVAILNRIAPADSGCESMEKQLASFIESVPAATVLSEKEITVALLTHYDFMLISYITWNDVSERYKEALQLMPSTLIISE